MKMILEVCGLIRGDQIVKSQKLIVVITFGRVYELKHGLNGVKIRAPISQ